MTARSTRAATALLHIGAVAVGAIAVAAAAALAGDKGQPLGDGVFSPEKGVVCDRRAGFCSDASGISMAFTEMHLGKAAQDKMMKLISDTPTFDTTTFVLSNGVECKTAQKACFKTKGSDKPAPNVTKALFQ